MSEKGSSEPFTKKPRTADTSPAKGPSFAATAPDQLQGTGSPIVPISFTLKDKQVLDCPICFDPLSSPLYQCTNGHVACASCCTSIKKICPSCSCPLGNIRCGIVEKIVESITLDCQNKAYGCEERVSYAKKLTHLRSCKYSPCCCPLPSCDFVGSNESLYHHFSVSHSSALYFSFGSFLYVKLNSSKEHAFLQEKDKKVVFVLTKITKPYGTLVKVICIAPASSDNAESIYKVMMSAGNHSVGMVYLKAPVECIAKWTAELPTTSYLMVPSNLVGARLNLKLEVGVEF